MEKVVDWKIADRMVVDRMVADRKIAGREIDRKAGVNENEVAVDIEVVVDETEIVAGT